MKSKVLIPLLIVGALGAFFSFKYIGSGGDATANNTDQHRQLVLNAVMHAIKDGHFSPREVNDSFSYRIFTKVLEDLDYEKKFFTAQDMKTIGAYKFKIDDEINTGSVEFFDQISTAFTHSIDRAEGLEKEILKTPFTFTGTDSVQLNGDKMTYAANDAALRDRWSSYLKYRVLTRYVDLKKEQDKKHENKDSANVALKTDAVLEADARASVSKNEESYFKKLRKIDNNDRFSLYVNAITNSEDPHTDYFPPRQKEKFDEQMSGSFMGIGASLKPEDGKVKVAAIVTGSPCWKEGELKAGDEIQKVAQGNAEPEDIQGFELDEVVDRIRGKKGTIVKLTVKKLDGTIKVIPIVRGEVTLEETFARSAIIKNPAGPIGYIYLPEFYADFNHTTGRRCAEDVAVEVQKLKTEGVAGIILDLRNNGGGSLSDVVDMAGLFVDQGPVVQVKSNDAEATVLRDNTKTALYTGPMAIMVNQNSASASEIMAAALQDYKRAVIVGTPTYGKGTVQKVIPLDEFVDPITRMRMASATKDGLGQDNPSIGSLKITVQKFYRINGGSTQLRGVTPDIQLPDPYKYLDLGERHDKAALKWDEIPAAAYKPTNSFNLPYLQAQSQKRVTANPIFTLVETSARDLKTREDRNTYSLNEAAYKKEVEQNGVVAKKLDEVEKKITPMAFVNPKDDLKAINTDSTSVKKNADWIKLLQKDVYLTETVNILNDIIRPGTKVNIGTGMK